MSAGPIPTALGPDDRRRLRHSGLAPTEAEAIEVATIATAYLRRAVRAYEAAGFGSHVTDPLRDAIASVEFSIREVRS